MPEPVVVHVIGTTTLLVAALLITASIAVVQQVSYLQTLNVMLSEAAEACARQIVELLSIHTIGGGDYTYMMLTLPRSLGGQPYNLTLVNLGENMIMVIAQLQLHRQVRIVVTPNFGKAPVYAVSAVMRFGDLVMTPTILLPTPLGWKTALVAVRSGDAILVGFTTQPPSFSSPIGPPNFMLVNWSLKLEGLVGSQQELTFAVWNKGSKGTVTVSVYDSASRLVASKTLTVEGGEIVWDKLPITLPSEKGSYVWRIECRYGGYLHDSRAFQVISKQPQIAISSCDSSISGEPNSKALINLVLSNLGDYDGTAQVSINTTPLYTYKLSAGQGLNLTLEVRLPSNLGSYIWTLSVKTLETGRVDERRVYVYVRDPNAPYINWVNATIDGLINWNARICTEIVNPSGSSYTVRLLLNGTPKDPSDLPINPGSRAFICFTNPLPDRRGIFKWNVSLVSSSALLDSRIIGLVVRGFDRVDRTALQYHTYDALPSDWGNKGGEWRVSNGILYGEDRSAGINQDGLCSLKRVGQGKSEQVQVERCAVIYYWLKNISTNLSSSGSLAALVQLRIDEGEKDAYRGFALLDGSCSRFYGVAFNRTSSKLYVMVFDERWRSLDSSAEVKNAGGWYTLFLRLTYTGYSLGFTYELYSTSSSPLVAKYFSTTVDFLPQYIGLFVSKKTGEFDNLVIALGDPRYVTVKGLPAGWRVELYSGSNLIAGGISQGNDVLLSVVRSPIITNAKIVVKDPSGLTRPEWQLNFLVMVGGDVIVFSP